MKLKDVYGDKKTGKILFEAGILIMIANLLCVVGIWQAISNGWEVTGDGELFFQAFIQSGGKYVITYLNQESIYISFLSVLFSFLGNKEELVPIINLILQLAGIGFFYFGAKKLFCFVFPLAVAVISGILSGCFYPVTEDCPMHIIWFLSGLGFWVIAKLFSNVSGLYQKHILLGILLGIFCYIDFAGFFLMILCMAFTFISKEFKLKEKGLHLLSFVSCGIIGFLCMFYLWNGQLFNITVYQYWFKDKMKYFTSGLGFNQYISLMIILAVSVVFHVIKRFGNVTSISDETDYLLQQIKEQEETEMRKTDVITEDDKALAINKTMKKSIEKEINDELDKSSELTVTATDTVVNAAVELETESNSQPESKKTVKFLENPLPVPKKHVRKEMNYAFEPSQEQMHYDLNNYRLDDDYDLKD